MEKSKPLQQLPRQLMEKTAIDQLTDMDLTTLATEAENTENRILQTALAQEHSWQADKYLRIQVNRITEWDDDFWLKGADQGVLVLDCCRTLHTLCRHLLQNANPKDCGTLMVPVSFRVTERDAIAHRWAAIREGLEKQGCSEPLLHLLDRPVEKFMAANIRYGLHDYRYLVYYLEEWEKWIVIPTKVGTPVNKDLIKQLIRLDYNSSRVFTHIVDQLTGEQLKSLTVKTTTEAALSYLPEGKGLLDKLKAWVVEQEADREGFVEAVLDRLSGEEDAAANEDQHVKRNMSVVTLAVFEKMLYDLGITVERNLETLAKKLAASFNTPHTARIQPHSLLKKFNVREQTVKLTIKGWLKQMDNWLDRNMN